MRDLIIQISDHPFVAIGCMVFACWVAVGIMKSFDDAFSFRERLTK